MSGETLDLLPPEPTPAALSAGDSPTARLAWFDIPAVSGALDAKGGTPTVRLAHQLGSQCDNSTKEGGWNGCGAPVNSTAPGLLVSYYYLEPFLKNQGAYRYRDWVMDSGAFSAHNSGVSIDLNKYVDKCLELLASDPTLTEVFSLDVIPSASTPLEAAKAAEQSLRNCEEMWRQGVPAVPTYHRGEPEEFLLAMAKDYPKVALGGVALQRGDSKRAFCEACFARVWPKRIHGLGMASEELIYGLPFHSTDATNWELSVCAFGNWQKFGAMSVRGSNQDLRSQVRHYLDVEAKARVRWAKEMAQLAALPDAWPLRHSGAAPVVRLSYTETGADPSGRIATALGQPDAKPKPAKAAPAPAGKMDDQCVDYWKNRL